MLRLVKDGISIDFLKHRRVFLMMSLVLLAATIADVLLQGINFGIDFTGGTLVQIQTEKELPVGDIRAALATGGQGEMTIQSFGAPNEYLIRMAVQENTQASALTDQMVNALKPLAGTTEVRRVEFVGPQIGEELRRTGLIAILISLIAILIYISFRFEFRYGVGAVAALGHDVMLTIGAFSLTQREVSLPVLAALLTVIGYSLNDTIVVFDRIRENRRRYKKRPLIEVLNMSLNDMLGRTLMTSLTTLVVLLALYFFGGSVINDFAFTLMFGVIVGTYSSIYIAAPVVLLMEGWYKRMAEQEAENDLPV